MTSQAGRIVVGYDGTDSSAAALDWAAAEALRRGRPLTVLHVIDYVRDVAAPFALGLLPEVNEEVSRRTATDGVLRAQKLAGTADVQGLTLADRVTTSLINVSGEAELLVVGTRGRGPVAGTVLGSTAFAVTAHAGCPVVVVRGDHPAAPGQHPPVVVGIDGSPGADVALRYAAECAAAAGTRLIVVIVYPSMSTRGWADAMYRHGYGIEEAGEPRFDTVAREVAEQLGSAAVRVVLDSHPGMDVEKREIEGRAVQSLCAAAERAGLLVVGSRGHGGFAGLMLGSVSHGLVHAAPCPVAVIHSTDQYQQQLADQLGHARQP